jgi:chromosome partitioning protein
VAIISILNEKGGSSKTTTCLSIAGTLAARGFKVAAVDTDSKMNLTAWHRRTVGEEDGAAYKEGSLELARQPVQNQGGLDLFQAFNPHKIPEFLVDLEEKYEVVLVDTAGAETLLNNNIIAMSNLVLIPAKDSGFDASNALKIVDMVKAAERTTRRKIPAAVVLVDVSDATNVTKHARVQVEQSGAILLDIALPKAAIFREVTWSGAVPKGGTPGVRIDKLIRTLMDMGHIPKKPSKLTA